MKKVLVTGASGFIGGYVTRRLLERGFTPVCFDRQDKDNRPEGSEFFLGDVWDDVAVTEAMAHSDGWIHLAGVLGTAETINNPRPAVATNILGGLNVFQAAAQYKVPGVNIAVGNHWFNNTYSITKSTMERFALMYNADRDTQITVVRALNAYGPYQVAAAPYGPSKVKKIMPAFVNAAIRGLPIEVYGTGENKMDMIYVADVAKILVAALEYTEKYGVSKHPFEAGSGLSPTVNEIASVVNEVCGTPSAKRTIPQIKHVGMRAGEKEGEVVVADVSTLHPLKDFGIHWQDFLPLDEGIMKTAIYFKDQM
jgi:UDP-glucose 4-epimerase